MFKPAFGSILITSGLSAVLSLVGCSTDTVKSSDVKPTTIYRSYVVTFDQRTLITTMFANFRVGGDTVTNVELDKPSDVSVSGVGLNLSSDDKKLNSALGANYQWEAPSSTASSGISFLWTRQDSTKVEDQLAPPAISTIALEACQFSIEKGIVIRLTTAVDPADGAITITSEAPDSKNIFASATRISASEYTIRPGDLAKFKPGKIRIDSSFTSRVSIPRSDQDLGGVKAYTIKLASVSAELK